MIDLMVKLNFETRTSHLNNKQNKYTLYHFLIYILQNEYKIIDIIHDLSIVNTLLKYKDLQNLIKLNK